MAINITYYNNNSDNIVVTKNLTEIETSSTAEIREATSVTDPVLLVRNTQGARECNFVYVSGFDRYYYVTEKQILNNNQIRLICHVDVLTTYRNQILASTQHIVRQANAYNMYMTDDKMTILTKKQRQIKNLIEPASGWILDNETETGRARFIINALGGAIE